MSGAGSTGQQSGLLPSVAADLAGAAAETRALLFGPHRGSRRRLWLLAMMGGVVGVGAQPPPFGLLAPLLEDAHVRAAAAEQPLVLPLSMALLVLLVALLPVARAFLHTFAEAVLLPGVPHRPWHGWLWRGTEHAVLASLATLPLYGLLFFAEAAVTGDTWKRMLNPALSTTEVGWLAAAGAARFAAVLLPWIALTLPVMVLLYELLPAVVVLQRVGPFQAVRSLLREAVSAPGRWLVFLAARTALQGVGTLAASLAMVLCLPVSLVAGLPIGAAAWGAAAMAGGPTTGGGAAAISVAVLLWSTVLYALLTAMLLPVSTYIYVLAGRMLPGLRGGAYHPTAAGAPIHDD